MLQPGESRPRRSKVEPNNNRPRHLKWRQYDMQRKVKNIRRSLEHSRVDCQVSNSRLREANDLEQAAQQLWYKRRDIQRDPERAKKYPITPRSAVNGSEVFQTSQYVRALRETLRRLGVEPEMVDQLTRGDDDCCRPVTKKRALQDSAATTSQHSRSIPPPRGGDYDHQSSIWMPPPGETGHYHHPCHYWYPPGDYYYYHPCHYHLQCQPPATQAAVAAPWPYYYPHG